MNLKRFLIGSLNLKAISTQLLASSSGTQQTTNFPCVVVFGRPGAGKTTVADTAVEMMAAEREICCLGLDLDVCVPEWMKENFAKGFYPTPKQREDFAVGCCDYVEKQVDEKRESGQENLAAVVSFSFVNTDLRDVFRSRFPRAKWVLIDTSENESTKRINMREDHFYKGEKSDDTKKDAEEPDTSDVDNSEWQFAPVAFDHVILDGARPIETNANGVVQVLREVVVSPIE
jgi:gluconate kinase